MLEKNEFLKTTNKSRKYYDSILVFFKFKENLNVKKKKNLSITNIYLDRCAIFLHISSVTQTLSSQETEISLAQIRYVTFCIL